nr:MAG TPA: hypothetical protein [Caudoviricetes sp.]
MKLMILIIRKTRIIRCRNKKIIVPLQKYFNRISYSIKYLKCYCRSWSARMKGGFFSRGSISFLAEPIRFPLSPPYKPGQLPPSAVHPLHELRSNLPLRSMSHNLLPQCGLRECPHAEVEAEVHAGIKLILRVYPFRVAQIPLNGSYILSQPFLRSCPRTGCGRLHSLGMSVATSPHTGRASVSLTLVPLKLFYLLYQTITCLHILFF